MCVCSWALRHPLVNLYILDSVLAPYAVLLDLTPLAAGKFYFHNISINTNPKLTYILHLPFYFRAADPP